jgi:hypothetical protein
VENNQISEEKAALLKDQLRFVVTGMLLFYMHRGQPADHADFLSMTDAQLNHILSF